MRQILSLRTAKFNLVVAIIVAALLVGCVGVDGELLTIWPFPLLYFIEILIISILCIVAVGMLNTNSKSLWSAIPWICSGILLAFIVLGAWTIGFFLIPAMLLLLFVGIFVDRRTQGDIPLHIIFYVGGAIAQASFVLLTLIS